MSIVRDFWNNVVGTADGAVDSVKQTVSTTVDTVTDNASAAVNRVTDNVSSEVQTVTNTASAVVNRVTDKASSAVKTATDNASAEVQTVTNTASAVVNTVTDNASAAVGTATDNAAARVKTATSNASAAIKSVTDNPDILSATDDASAAINTATDDASTSIKNTADDTASAVKSRAGDATTAVRTATDDASTAVKTTTDDASSAVKGATDDAATAIKTETNDAATTVKTTTDDASAAVKGAADDPLGAVKDAKNFVSDEIDTVTDKAAAEVKSAKDNASAAVKGAKDFVSGEIDAAADTATGVVKSVAGAISDAAPMAVADMGAAFNSGGSLPSPSSVNSQNAPNPVLDGPNASAGDSYFVTGGYQGQLVARAKSIKAAAQQLYEVEKNLEKGAGGFLGFGTDKELLESAKNVHGVADGMIKLAQAIDDWTGKDNKETLEKGSKGLEYVSKLIDLADAVGAVQKLNLSVDQLAAKPSEASVNAWADSVGDTFDKAANLLNFIPSDGLPGFILSYYKGLLSAPKNYINAFKNMMRVHYGEIDKEAGVFHGDKRVSDGSWEGDLTDIYYPGYFEPKAQDGTAFTDFMIKHRKTENMDLWKVALQMGKVALLAAISRDMPDEDPAKDAWLTFVGKF